MQALRGFLRRLCTVLPSIALPAQASPGMPLKYILQAADRCPTSPKQCFQLSIVLHASWQVTDFRPCRVQATRHPYTLSQHGMSGLLCKLVK